MLLIIAVVVVVLVSVVLSAILYVLTSGLISGPTSFKPIVAFASPVVAAGTATLTVVGVTPVVTITSYKFNLELDGQLATAAVSLSAGNHTITVGSTTFYLLYRDVAGNGNLKTGDEIQVGMAPSGYLPSGSYSFILLWAADGTAVATVNWAV